MTASSKRKKVHTHTLHNALVTTLLSLLLRFCSELDEERLFQFLDDIYPVIPFNQVGVIYTPTAQDDAHQDDADQDDAHQADAHQDDAN